MGPQALPAKNTLIGSDARLVQLAFELRLSALDGVPDENALQAASAANCEGRGSETSAQSAPGQEPCTEVLEPIAQHSGGPNSGGIDKSVLTLSEVRRYRDKAHIKFVASRPCLVCGRKPVDPHHLRFAQVRAVGRKVSDEFTVPLCRSHHRELHRSGNERGWWKGVGIDPLKIARALWKRTRPSPRKLPNTAASAAEAARS